MAYNKFVTHNENMMSHGSSYSSPTSSLNFRVPGQLSPSHAHSIYLAELHDQTPGELWIHLWISATSCILAGNLIQKLWSNRSIQ